MLLYLFFGTVIGIAVFEIISLKMLGRHLRVEYEADTGLVEPGETLTFRYAVYNMSSWPILFLRVSLYLDDAAVLREDPKKNRHVRQDRFGTRVDHRLYLLPRRRFAGKVRLSFDARGIHRIGKIYLETGDFMALRSDVITQELDTRVVCTAKLSSDPVDVRTLGGFLGDISVRRFIHEDPSLLIGYQEYTGNEPMKKISWMQTARTGQLMVKKNDYTVDTNVAVLVNMQNSSRGDMEACLRLVRSVCEHLEAARIPYALLSNGDLHSAAEGQGRPHLFGILRRIGRSDLACFSSFRQLVERCAYARREGRSYIVVTPPLSEEGKADLALLQRFSDHELCVLCGREGGAA